jgi:hypothetical protein
MRPKQTVVDLHKNYVTWNAFFSNFVLDRGLDLRREFLRILTLTQHEAEAAGLAPRRLMPLWLSICSESGGTGLYDESYLRVALLGLRRLPLGEEFSSNEDFALQGLARWAAARNPSQGRIPARVARPRRRLSARRRLLAAPGGAGDRGRRAGAVRANAP